ncbi:IS110 family transposase [Roseomonas sp. KE2513]|nr:IS110 family transposase [Roseomonas sp. KE2513]
MIPEQPKVTRLVKLAGIEVLSATALVAEVFHRHLDDRRHLASYLGLVPSPQSSGDTEWDQDISKAGDRVARVLLVELA